MKKFITMRPMNTGGYKFIEKINSEFYSIYETLELHIVQIKFSGLNLIDWLFDTEDECYATELLCIDKQNNKIVLYDTSDSMDEEYTGEYLNPNKRFEMSRENFIDLLYSWEKLQVSKPDTILIVFHEDNYVTLETDPIIIKQYQDAGYAFDINKSNQHA